ncbi:MAG: hypothetical protein ACP5VP_03705 [Candidatus Limnocylindrales bacterium]
MAPGEGATVVATAAATAPAAAAFATLSPAGSPPAPAPSRKAPAPGSTTRPASHVAGAPLPGEPNPSLTPGATYPAVTQATIRTTICVTGWTATVRPPSSYTTALKRTQLVLYGDTDRNLADYEEDHLIPLELGGAPSDPKNLWPEPYAVRLRDGTPVGARVKDQLEDALHALVCRGTMPLAQAQELIRVDWITAWRTYVAGAGVALPAHTPAPVPGATPASTTAPGPGAVGVTILSLTSPVSRGGTASLTARTAPLAACSITVVYKSGTSKASGLVPRAANAAGSVTWTWTVGTHTTPGTWPVTVSCAAGGRTATATRSFAVQ